MPENKEETQCGLDKRDRKFHLLLRSLVLFNLAFIALSCVPWFSGTAKTPGFADRLFGNLRFGGFRADVVWLTLSTGAILLALPVFAVQFRARSIQVSVLLCIAEIASFCGYVYYALRSGLFYMG